MNTFQHGLRVLWGGRDVTDTHLMLGYKPLLIGLVARPGDPTSGTVLLDFVSDDGIRAARLTLVIKHTTSTEGQNDVLIAEGVYGEHTFLNALYQKVNKLRQHLRKSSKDNVSLPGNLQEQVRIAYAIPRKISVITTSDGTMVNMFPTDLHGWIGTGYYAGSLRTGGKANEQVSRFRRIVISEVSSASFRETYRLGKNHMSELQAPVNLALHREKSAVFKFPLPPAVSAYLELELRQTIESGIHQLHFYKVINRGVVDPVLSSLAHIHQYYMQWRQDRGMETPWLIR